MKTKQRIRMEIKEISADGTFEGLLAVYGNVDQGGDVVAAGAFTKSIKDRGSEIPMLWQHKPDVPIGKLSLEDGPDALKVKGQLLMELPEAQKAYLLIKAKIVRGLSIGFESVKDVIDKGIRKLLEVKLYEGSIVTFPMNEQALITNVKARREGKGDFNEELNEIQLGAAGYQMRSALAQALSSLFWSGLTREEVISASETIIQQFSDAYMAYLPSYIDMLTEYYGDMETWSQKRLETKAGRMISAANKETIQSACAQIKSGHDILLALSEDEAGADATTSDSEAAAPKSEPIEEDHSAAQSLIGEIKALFRKA